MRRQSFILPAIAAVLCLSTQLATRIRATALAESKTGEIVVRVIDGAGATQPDAVVSLFTYDPEPGTFVAVSHDRTTDASGIVRLDGLVIERNYLVRATTRSGQIGYRQRTLHGRNSKLDVDLKVGRPVAATIHVHDENGAPVSGASIGSISFGEAGERISGFVPQHLMAIGFSLNRSSASGELRLPELPAGTIGVSLIHPDYVPTWPQMLDTNKREPAVITLARGVKLKLRIEAEPGLSPVQSLQIRFTHEPDRHGSIDYVPLSPPGPDGTTEIRLAAGKYSWLELFHPQYLLTPSYDIGRGRKLSDDPVYFELPGDGLTFRVQRRVRVRGHVLDEATRRPVAGVAIDGKIPSHAEQSPLARFTLKWNRESYQRTNERGEFELDLAAGPARFVVGRGFISRARHYDIDVAADGSTVAPDILVRPMPQVRGVVLDQSGKAFVGAIVRFRGSELAYDETAATTDAKGCFTLAPSCVPVDPWTDEPMPEQTVVAYDPQAAFAAESQIHLDDEASLGHVELRMKPQDYGALLTSYADEFVAWEHGTVRPGDAKRQAAVSLVGKPAPELDGAAWLNTDKPKMSLADFRGKYVLLQFWATWCGTCHHDMPNVKLAHELYKEQGLAVIGVHDNSMPLDAIKVDAAKNGLSYPIVVDHPDGRLYASYREHGMAPYYPSYVLIGPDGKILLDDQTVAGPTLGSFKVEIIRQLLMAPQAGVGAALRIENGKVLVTSIVPDSAAARTDALHHDDQIVAIAEEHGEPVEVAGLALEKVVSLIRGRNGTVVRLNVIPAGKEASEAHVASLTRGHVQTPFGGLGDGKLLSPGTMAPNFKFSRLADGKTDELAGQRGKVVILVAWASWCKPCLEHLAKLDALAAEHPEWKDRLEILPLSIDESREDAADCSKSHHWSKLSAAWTGPTICDAYHINGIPATYIISSDGKIIAANSFKDISNLIHDQHLLDSSKTQPSEKK